MARVNGKKRRTGIKVHNWKEYSIRRKSPANNLLWEGAMIPQSPVSVPAWTSASCEYLAV